jgi:nucleotide-binding universal stress UspA family protein
MSRPILAGYDPRSRDRAPIRFGLAMARLTGAPLLVACVQRDPLPIMLGSDQTVEYAVAQLDPDLVDDCFEALDEIDAESRASGVRVDAVRLTGTSAARALHEAAEREDAGLVVAGSSRRGAPGGLLLGSTTERLIGGAPCPVTVVPAGWAQDELRTIGVAYVDSEEGHEALRGAVAIARRTNATVRAFTVVRPGLSLQLEAGAYEKDHVKTVEEVEGDRLLRAEQQLREAVGELDDDVHVEIEAVAGEPADVLADLSRGVDVLICGSRGYGPLRAVLLGSVTRRLANEAHCPLIVLPRGVRSTLEALVEQGAAAPA